MKVFGWTIGVLVAVLVVNFAPMLSLKMPGMEGYTAHGITLFAYPDDRRGAEAMAARIAERSGTITAALDAEEDDGIGVIVYPHQRALRRKTLGLAGMVLLPDWFIGDNTSDWVLIVSPASPGPAHSRESVEQAAVHEYVHVLTDRRNRELGYWLKEGIALYLADQKPEVQSLATHADITYEEFARPNALQFAQVGGYSLAYHMIDYLAGRYGWEAIVALTAPDATWESVLGLGERRLFTEWKARLVAMLEERGLKSAQKL